MKTVVDSASPTPRKKPLFALLLATGLGLGYLPKAPGTWGSLLGLGISWAFLRLWPHAGMLDSSVHPPGFTVPFLPVALLACLSVALVGVWAAGRAERYFGEKDPQKVVLDEVSGQMIVLLFGIQTSASYLYDVHYSSNGWTGFLWKGSVNWKYLLLGFILFRVFDIWKPFPARQAERLPGGWGIMADDWVAAVYAALGLRVAQALGL